MQFSFGGIDCWKISFDLDFELGFELLFFVMVAEENDIDPFK